MFQILAFDRQSHEKRKPIQVDTIAREVLKLIRSTIPTTVGIGEITVDSKLGHGTVFNIYLPTTKKREDQRKHKTEKLPSGNGGVTPF